MGDVEGISQFSYAAKCDQNSHHAVYVLITTAPQYVECHGVVNHVNLVISIMPMSKA